MAQVPFAARSQAVRKFFEEKERGQLGEPRPGMARPPEDMIADRWGKSDPISRALNPPHTIGLREGNPKSVLNKFKNFDVNDPDQVRLMQQKLVNRGYDIGTSGEGGLGVDAVFGPKTESAYRQWVGQVRGQAGKEAYTYGQ